jgi:2-amino-4-hydroxy-6-hydroxymethyldihydropteridine diphosphokinase
MAHCLIGLGSNLGNRRETLEAAVAHFELAPSLRLVTKSPWYETAAVGGPPNQPAFLNGAVLLETALEPQALLAVLQRLEIDLGRQRAERWGPRTIDLDLLLYDQLRIETSSLTVPHPQMAWRRFVLQPAAVVAGSMLHPTTGWTLSRLLAHLDAMPPYVAITGSIGTGKSELAQRLAKDTGGRLLAEPFDLEELEAFFTEPTGRAWQMGLKSLGVHARLLAADAQRWSSDRPELTVSDFWFDQSLAFARVWLAATQFAAFRRRWEEARCGVVRPKLIVLLAGASEPLHDRQRWPGRDEERGLSDRQRGELAQAILEQATEPHQGPLLRLDSDDPQARLAEVSAAVAAMEGKVTLA